MLSRVGMMPVIVSAGSARKFPVCVPRGERVALFRIVSLGLVWDIAHVVAARTLAIARLESREWGDFLHLRETSRLNKSAKALF